jgi:hypothetical protein
MPHSSSVDLRIWSRAACSSGEGLNEIEAGSVDLPSTSTSLRMASSMRRNSERRALDDARPSASGSLDAGFEPSRRSPRWSRPSASSQSWTPRTRPRTPRTMSSATVPTNVTAASRGRGGHPGDRSNEGVVISTQVVAPSLLAVCPGHDQDRHQGRRIRPRRYAYPQSSGSRLPIAPSVAIGSVRMSLRTRARGATGPTVPSARHLAPGWAGGTRSPGRRREGRTTDRLGRRSVDGECPARRGRPHLYSGPC